jgi:hypothetical protein
MQRGCGAGRNICLNKSYRNYDFNLFILKRRQKSSLKGIFRFQAA